MTTDEEPLKAPLNFPVSRELKARIKTYAAAQGLTLAGACRVLLIQSLNRYEQEMKARAA